MVPVVGLPVWSRQRASHSQDTFRVEPSHHAQHKRRLQEARMVAQGPAPSTLPSPSPIPIPGPSNTLVLIEECTVPITEDMPAVVKETLEGMNVDPSTVRRCSVVDEWWGIHCADPSLCSQGLSPRFERRSD